MKPEIMTDDEYKAHKQRQYTEDIIKRAEVCQATGELPFPICILPIPLRVVALIIQDVEWEQRNQTSYKGLL